jgi:hypothetical protein
VRASTHDRFVQQLETVQAALPVVTAEVGDTWVTSQSADPWKWVFYREASRAYSECKLAGQCDPAADPRVSNFLRLLIKLPEHTGGPDNFAGGDSWTNAQFHTDLADRSPGVVAAERAYLEQREIASVHGLRALGDHPLAGNLTRRMAALQPLVPNTTLLVPVPAAEWAVPLTVQTSTGEVSVGIDPATGGLSTVRIAGVDWAGPRNQLAQFVYKTFNDTDYLQQRGFCCYGAPGRQQAANPNRTSTSPRVTGLWRRATGLTARLEMPAETHERYLLVLTARRNASLLCPTSRIDWPDWYLPTFLLRVYIDA